MSRSVSQPAITPPAPGKVAFKAVPVTAANAAAASALIPGLGADGEPVGFYAGMKHWFLYQAPAWMVSTVVHMVIFLIMALVLGSIPTGNQKSGAPEFAAADTAIEPEMILEDFELGEKQYDPSKLDADTLIITEAQPVAQEEEKNDDSEIFEKKGGGTESTDDSNLGGMSLDIAAGGLGPKVKGEGGISGGGGTGNKAGKGGAGSGFGGRGAGSRKGQGGTEATERAVGAALNWIARHQNKDGSWNTEHNTALCNRVKCSGGGSSKANVGGTALGLLPFLAAGQTHQTKGPYQQNIIGGISYLISRQKPNGALASDSQHEMYEHGLATIALCEAYGMTVFNNTPDNRLSYAAQAAIGYIEAAQNPKGGWRYKANAPDTDTSVVAWQIMALKSAQMAGLQVNAAVLEKAKTDLKTASSGYKGGTFGYTPGRGASPSMTGAGLLCTQYLGAARNDPAIIEGIGYLMEHQPDAKSRNVYYWYYATQVMHNVPGPDWETWNRRMRRVLVDTQERDGCKEGSWNPSGDDWGDQGGRLMVTSLSCLTLEVYYRYLPLYKLDKDEEDQPKEAKPLDLGEKPADNKPVDEAAKEKDAKEKGAEMPADKDAAAKEPAEKGEAGKDAPVKDPLKEAAEKAK